MYDWKSHFQRLSDGADFGGSDFGVDVDTVKQVQAKLNSLGWNPPLTVDGNAGPLTATAVIAFQQNNHLTVDGKIGPQVLKTLGLMSVPSPQQFKTASIAAVRGIDKLNQDDLKALVETANWIGISPDWLAAAISFESGFSTSISNAAGSGATGLIQFMPNIAQNLLGTSTPQEAVNKLKSMSFVDQLEVVKKYFEPYRGKLNSLEDTYLAIFYPAFIGKPLSEVLGSTGSAIYNQNSGFDKTKKGYVTKEDITSTIRSVLDGANGRIPVAITVASVAMTTGLLLWTGMGAVVLFGYFLLNKGKL